MSDPFLNYFALFLLFFVVVVMFYAIIAITISHIGSRRPATTRIKMRSIPPGG